MPSESENQKIERPAGMIIEPPEGHPEVLPEAPAEKPPEAELKKPVTVEETPSPKKAASPPLAPPVPSPKDLETVAIENILSEGLEDTYRAMEPALRERFRKRGEEIAGKIRTMIKTARVRTRGILNLIRGWLRLIPGVSRFFLEQEAKIKTDKVLKYAEREKEET